MQEVSTRWNETQTEHVITVPSILELEIVVTDPDVQADASSASNGETKYSHAGKLTDGLIKTENRIATLEQNFWLLNSSFDLLPNTDQYDDDGYIGNTLSGADGTFAVPPAITVTFSKVYTSYLEGVTIAWGVAYENEHADTFTVTAYNGATVVATKTVTGNTDTVSVVFMEITGYDSIKITVEKWAHPRSRARIQSLLLGIKHTYTKSNVKEYEHKQSVDLLSAELPNIETTFQVDNLDFLYDPDNEGGMSKYLMSRQQVTIRYGYEIDGKAEKIPAAVVFLDEWRSPRDGIHAEFTARSLLVFMEEKYTGITSGTLYEISLSALKQANLPLLNTGEVRWMLDDTLKAVSAPADTDLSDYSIAEVLQLCANAARCVMWQDRQGILHIESFSAEEATGYSITNQNAYSYPETSLSKPLKSVNINDGMYVLSVAETGVEQTVDNPLVSSSQAPAVAVWIRDILLNRQILTGEWRADPKTDVLDTVSVSTPFKMNRTVLTSVELTFNGAFRGDYEGRVI